MPQSDQWAIPWVLETIARIDPDSILDIGIGMGAYGFQLRVRLDIAPGRLHPCDWQKRIDGVEVFDDYRNPLWSYYYNEVFTGDGMSVIKDTPVGKYDLMLLCDVFEHFRRDDALALLEAMRARAKWVIITTPVGHYAQGAIFSNPAETHLSEWVPEDLSSLGAVTLVIDNTFLAVFAPDDAAIQALELDRLPVLFKNTGRSLARCVRRWMPLMLRSRLFGTSCRY